MEEGKGERYLASGRQYGNALLGVRHQEEEVANPQSWGRGGRRGSGMVPFERALVCSYRLYSNFSSIFMRFRDIAAFVLQHATFPHRTYSPQNFPMFPWE